MKRRQFFDDLAKSKGFDPLDVDKWSTIAHTRTYIVQVDLAFCGITRDHTSEH